MLIPLYNSHFLMNSTTNYNISNFPIMIYIKSISITSIYCSYQRVVVIVISNNNWQLFTIIVIIT